MMMMVIIVMTRFRMTLMRLKIIMTKKKIRNCGSNI